MVLAQVDLKVGMLLMNSAPVFLLYFCLLQADVQH